MCIHSVDGGEVGLHSQLLAESQLYVCVICAAYFSAAPRDCTNRPYLPSCKAIADGLGFRLSNQDYLHLLYASGVALYHTVLKPRCKQASIGSSTGSLLERGSEPLGSLNKSFTVRNTRGLPFDASYACKGMHNSSHSSFSDLILLNITNRSVTQPGGELLLGLPTLLTRYHVNAAEDTSAKQPYGEL